MKYKLSQSVRLTDFKNGRLESTTSTHSIIASQLHLDIASHFQELASWDDFKDQSAAAKAAFSEMREAGFLLDADTLSSQPMSVLFRPETTIFDVPFRCIDDLSEGEIVFLGAPIDIGTSGYPGARYGPQAIRSASVERYQCKIDFQTGSMVGWNVPSLGGGILDGARMSDLGDLPYTPGQPAEDYYTNLRNLVGQIYAAGAFPIVLGGDHSITYSTVPDDAAVLVHIDAHCDLAERIPGHCHHHGNVLRRLLDEGRVSEIHHYGLRDTAGWDTMNAGTFPNSVGDIEVEGWENPVAGKRAFISLDVDVLDPSVLPGTGTPVVGGLNLRQLCQTLARLTQVTRPVGLDIVELCPIRDESGLSERTVIEALLCFLAVHHSSKLGSPSEL